MAAVIEHLQDQNVLMVLDNCEHVIEAAATLADRILRETHAVRILVTSREPLRVEGERVHRLMPLEYPPFTQGITADEAMSYAAVQLLVDRTASHFGSFALDDFSAQTATEICRRLDGIPLAIELAAVRVEFFGLSGLSRSLNDMFAILTRGRRFALPRHQTLRAALDWSYNLLSPIEQTVLQRISTFRAAFTLDFAITVVSTSLAPIEDIVEAMESLVARSMLTASVSDDVVQYRLLEPTRVYAGEKLAASGSGRAVARRHAESHLQLIRTAPGNWESQAGKAWLRAHAGRIDDVRAALDWCISDVGDLPLGLSLTIASARLWFQLSLTLECRDRVATALVALRRLPRPKPDIEMRLQAALGHAIWYSAGDVDHLEAAFGRALDLAVQLGDVPLQLQALWGSWAAQRARGEFRNALIIAERYRTLARISGDAAAELLGDRILGLTHHYRGNQVAARDHAERVLRVVRGPGNALHNEFQLSPEIAATTILTRVLWLEGYPDQAQDLLQQAIAAARRTDHWYSMYYVVCFAGLPLSLWIGDLAQAQQFLNATVNRAAGERWRQRWAFIMRLRQSDAHSALIASALEPRVDSKLARVMEEESAHELADRLLDEVVGDAHWSLPEILRVNAELQLWRGGPGCREAAEAKLMRSLELARQQSVLSWELRSATSLGRLWARSDRIADARAFLASVYERFSEGFETADLVEARRLLDEWS